MSEIPFGKEVYERQNREGKLYRLYVVEKFISGSCGLGQIGLTNAHESLLNERQFIASLLENPETASEARNMACVIEGKLNERVVYREESSFAKYVPSMNTIPAGKEEEVEYCVTTYALHQENKRADGEIYRVF